MIATLKQYAKHKDGTYVSLEMSKESRELLDNFVRMNLGLEEGLMPRRIIPQSSILALQFLMQKTFPISLAYLLRLFPLAMKYSQPRTMVYVW